MSINELQSFEAIQDLARRALLEDATHRDVTIEKTDLFMKLRGVDVGFNKSFVVVAKCDGVFSGRVWLEALSKVSGVEIEARKTEGQEFYKGEIVCTGRGTWKQILSLERTLLNELQMLCGVATHTHQFVTELSDQWKSLQESGKVALDSVRPEIYHTRKTLPLHRALQIYAVLAGGGKAHRNSLGDRVLFKENHKQILAEKKLSFAEFLKFLVGLDANALVEVENLAEAQVAAGVGVKHLMLDNFSPEQVREAVAALPTNISIEVSGGLTLSSLASYLIPGVHRLSVGAITHGSKALDLSLDWV